MASVDPTRAEILRILDSHATADDKESRDIAHIRRLALEHEDILSRRCLPGHITASALVIDLDTRRVLLHLHRKLRRWLQVGGHLNADETDVAQAALREAREETGLPDLAFHPPGAAVPLDFDAHEIPPRGDMPAHLHLDFRYLMSTRQPHALNPQRCESTAFRWLRVDEALDMGNALDYGLRRLLRKARAIC